MFFVPYFRVYVSYIFRYIVLRYNKPTVTSDMIYKAVIFMIRRLLALLMLVIAILLPRDLALEIHELIKSW